MKTDRELKRDVENELKWEPSVNEAHVGVTVHSGVVTLTGHVPSFGEKYSAEKAAKRVYGVKAVADELDVKLPGSAKRTDEDIAQSCVNALAARYAVPDDKIDQGHPAAMSDYPFQKRTQSPLGCTALFVRFRRWIRTRTQHRGTRTRTRFDPPRRSQCVEPAE